MHCITLIFKFIAEIFAMDGKVKYKHCDELHPNWREEEKKALAAAKVSEEDCSIGIRISLAEDRLIFQVIDNGIGIENAPPGVSGIDEFIDRGGGGGLGLLIIRNFMDDVEYSHREGSGTVLTMTKYLGTPGLASS